MNNLLGTKDLIARLDTLKAVAQDYAAREEKLNSVFRDQTAKEKMIFETAGNELLAGSTRKLDEEADAFARSKAQLQATYTRRNARINRVQNRIRANHAARIEERDKNNESGSQQAWIAAERKRDEDLANANATFENFQQRLAGDTSAFQGLEKKVRSAAGGVGGFRRELDASVAVETNPADDGNGMLDEVRTLSERIEGELKKHKGGFILCAIPAPQAKMIAADFVRAKSLVVAAPDHSAAWLEAEKVRIAAEYLDTKNSINTQWKRATREIAESRNQRPVELDSRIAALQKRNEQFYHSGLTLQQQSYENNTARLREESAKQSAALEDKQNQRLAKLDADYQSGWRELETGWRRDAVAVVRGNHGRRRSGRKMFSGLDGVESQRVAAATGFFERGKIRATGN